MTLRSKPGSNCDEPKNKPKQLPGLHEGAMGVVKNDAPGLQIQNEAFELPEFFKMYKKCFSLAGHQILGSGGCGSDFYESKDKRVCCITTKRDDLLDFELSFGTCLSSAPKEVVVVIESPGVAPQSIRAVAEKVPETNYVKFCFTLKKMYLNDETLIDVYENRG